MLRVAASWIVLVGACAPAPAEKLSTPRPLAYTPQGSRRWHAPPPPEPVGLRPAPRLDPVAMPRPEIAVPGKLSRLERPDPSEHMRWPLTANVHPALEPAYAIAPVFAVSGTSWMDLCRLGAQNRRVTGVQNDQLEYLRAWCDVGRRDTDSAVVRLAPLLRSTVLGMPAAVRRDVTNILVDAGDADMAQRLLAKAKIDDLAVFDTLAASYVEIGKLDDATTLNEAAIGAYDFANPAHQCERITRRLLIATPDVRARGLADFDPYVGNRSCAVLAHEMTCWATSSCEGFLLDHGFTPAEAKTYAIYFEWPTAGADSATWWSLANRAFDQLDTPGAAALATAAIEATIRSDHCTGDRAHDARSRAFEIKMSDTHDKALDPRLDVILNAPEKVCAEFR